MIIRRVLITILVAGIVVPGCGLAMRQRETESIWVIGTVSRTYKAPSYRVAFATLEAMRSELVESDFSDGKSRTFSPYEPPKGAKGAVVQPVEAQPSDNDPAFWADMNFAGNGRPQRQPTLLDSCEFAGLTKDKAKVHVSVKRRPTSTLVTVHVGHRGDAIVSDVLLNKVTEILEHPTYLAGSREEGDAIRAFFAGPDARRTLPSLDKPDAPQLDEDELKERAEAKAKTKKKAPTQVQ